MSCKGFKLGFFLLASLVAFPIIGSGEPIIGPYKPERPSSPAPQKFPRCIEFEKEINKYENDVKRLQKEIEQEKVAPKKKNNNIFGFMESKKYRPSDDEIITIDRSNPEELSDHYKAITKEARSELSLALQWKNEDTDPECERRLEKFNILIKGNTRYKRSQ